MNILEIKVGSEERFFVVENVECVSFKKNNDGSSEVLIYFAVNQKKIHCPTIEEGKILYEDLILWFERRKLNEN